MPTRAYREVRVRLAKTGDGNQEADIKYPLWESPCGLPNSSNLIATRACSSDRNLDKSINTTHRVQVLFSAVSETPIIITLGN